MTTEAASRRHEGRYLVLLVAIVVAEFIVLSILAPSTYPTVRNLLSMGFQLAPTGILALAVGATLLIAGIDLSVVATANLSAIAAATTMTRLADGEPVTAVAVAVVAALAVGAACGAFNGALVSWLDASPIVITLGTLLLYTGIGTGLTGGSTRFGISEFQQLGIGTVLGLPLPFVIFVLLAVGLGVVTGRRRWGFRAYVIGASDTVALYNRYDIQRVQLATYTMAGMLSSIAGLITLASTNAASVSFGTSFLLLAILVAVLAGIDPYGGSGRLLGVPLAMIAIQQLSTGMNMVLRGSPGANFAKEFAWGLLLIIVLALGRSSAIRSLRELLTDALGSSGANDRSQLG